MNLSLGNFTVYDVETDGLLPELTLIHCIVTFTFVNFKLVEAKTFRRDRQGPESIDAGIAYLESQLVVAGHNIIWYDQRAKKKIYPNYKEQKHQWDSLALSWYLYPKQFKNGFMVNRKKFGLEEWGEEFGMPKVEVTDWQNLTVDEYCARCYRDVEINSRLMLGIMEYLLELYENNEQDILRFLAYIQFKMECIREQMEMGLYVDRERCAGYLEDIEKQINERFERLQQVMPKVPVMKTFSKPKTLFKADNTLSVAGQRWKDACEKHGHNYLNTDSFKAVDSFKEPNAGSPIQIKEWLFSLGWEPIHFKDVKNSKGEFNSVPQIGAENAEDGELCDSILELMDDHPELEELAGLSILKHRKGVFQGFLDESDDFGWTTASAQGFTNTLRFKHQKPIANLPKVSKPWGKEIRSLICVPEDSGYVLCGSDMSSLEDTTKQHYMYYFDPEYVMEMRTPGFDPHISIGVFSNMIAKEDEEFFIWYKQQKDTLDNFVPTAEQKSRYDFITEVRGKAKVVNFSGVYGAGAAKMAKTLKSTLEFAQKLHTAYWERNKAVKQVEASVVYKELHGQLWLYNPVSRFWYTLRALKDRFSTLNQGTGVYCFDTNLMFIRKQGIKIFLQYHDEWAAPVKVGEEEQTKQKLNLAISQVNDMLKLNVPLGISMDFGLKYSDIH